MSGSTKIQDKVIPASVLKVFSEAVATMRGNAERLCSEHGIDLNKADEEGQYISLSSYVNLLESSSEQLGQPHFGLRIAMLHKLDDFGPIVPLIRSADTLMEALRYLVTYQPVHVPLMSYSLMEIPGRVTELCWIMRLPQHVYNRQVLELGLGVVMQLIRDLLSPEFRPSYVRIAAKGPKDEHESLRRYFGCDVLYGQPLTSIAIPTLEMRTRLRTKDKFLVGLMKNHLDRIRVRSDVPLEKRVEMMVNAMLPLGSFTLNDCARQLGLAPRTLQSRLAAEGTDFSDVLENQRRLLAEGYLRDSQLALAEIASILGYSDPATFSRAFKGWTGKTPSSFKNGASDINSRRLPCATKPVSATQWSAKVSRHGKITRVHT